MLLKEAIASLFLLTWAFIIPAYSQQASEDFMRSTGKIYVVVAVVIAIFLLLIGYLIYLDRKIRNLEKQIPNGKNQN